MLKGYRKRLLSVLALAQPIGAYVGWSIDPHLVAEWIAEHKTLSLTFQGVISYLIHHFDVQDKKEVAQIKDQLRSTTQDRVDVEPNRVDVEPNRVDVEPNRVDVEPNRVDVEPEELSWDELTIAIDNLEIDK